jgi:hypothetical protein
MLSRRGRIRAVSTARAREHRRRVERLRATLHGPARCQWLAGCVREAVDAHELLSRARGGSIDPDSGNVVLLCREHHNWVTWHPAEAGAMGLSLSRLPVSDRTATVERVSDTHEHTPRLSVRLAESGLAHIDGVAAQSGTTRTVVVRAMLATAAAHPREVAAKIKELRDA